jgi:hypothetical protein
MGDECYTTQAGDGRNIMGRGNSLESWNAEPWSYAVQRHARYHNPQLSRWQVLVDRIALPREIADIEDVRFFRDRPHFM